MADLTFARCTPAGLVVAAPAVSVASAAAAVVAAGVVGPAGGGCGGGAVDADLELVSHAAGAVTCPAVAAAGPAV